MGLKSFNSNSYIKTASRNFLYLYELGKKVKPNHGISNLYSSERLPSLGIDKGD